MAFPATVSAALEGRGVKADLLVEFQFQSVFMLLWNGHGDLTTNDGKTWKGLRGLGQVEGLDVAVNGNAPPAVFSISGVDPRALAEEQGDPADYVNQPVIVYLQCFDDDWKPLDDPCAIWGGTMQVLQESYGWDDSRQASISTIGVTAESWFVGRGRPPYSFYSRQDQAGRSSGDKGLDYMASLQNYTVRWPTF